MSFDVEVVRPAELPPADLAAWRRLHADDATLASPYFCPEFTLLAAEVRRGVAVGVIRRAGRTIGFFPFELTGRRSAGPVGGPVSDCQGLIAEPGFACDPLQLLKKCRLDSWEFDHLLAVQPSFAPFHCASDVSPLIDVSAGFAAYCAERSAAGSQLLPQLGRKRRKLERELGPLRFEPHAADAGVLSRLIEWKSQQYRASGIADVFAYGWTRELLERIVATQTAGFAGMLTALYAGDRLIAVHCGMRSAGVWHYWFPAYDRDCGRHSPGAIMLLEMARSAPDTGLGTIDLGKDGSIHKQRFSNAAVALAAGRVPRQSPSRVQQAGRRLTAMIRRTPLVYPARIPSRLMRRYRDWKRFR